MRARCCVTRVRVKVALPAIPHLSEADSAPLDREADQSVTAVIHVRCHFNSRVFSLPHQVVQTVLVLSVGSLCTLDLFFLFCCAKKERPPVCVHLHSHVLPACVDMCSCHHICESPVKTD